jgi:peptidoglycan/LPS O-acetylase OafA/YrhL
MWPTVLMTSIATPLLTLVAAVALYRYVEAPAIAFGKRLFKDPVRAAGLQAAATPLANDA